MLFGGHNDKNNLFAPWPVVEPAKFDFKFRERGHGHRQHEPKIYCEVWTSHF